MPIKRLISLTQIQTVGQGQDNIYGPQLKGRGLDATNPEPLPSNCYQQIKRGDSRFGYEVKKDQKDKPLCETCEAEREKPLKQKRNLKTK